MICLGAVLILGLCRLGLNTSFWLGLMGLAQDGHPILMLCIGACFTLLEILGLHIVDQIRPFPAVARSWLILWICIVGLNFFADMSGIAEILHKDTDSRTVTQSAFQEHANDRDAAIALRDKYTAALAEQKLDLPLTTLQANRGTLLALIARRGDGQATYTQQVDLGRLNAAIETAAARDKAEADRRAAQEKLETFGAPPTALPASFQEVANIIGLAHVHVSAEQVHAAFVFLLALVIQATLIIAPRALLQLPEEETSSDRYLTSDLDRSEPALPEEPGAVAQPTPQTPPEAFAIQPPPERVEVGTLPMQERARGGGDALPYADAERPGPAYRERQTRRDRHAQLTPDEIEAILGVGDPQRV